MAPPHAVDDDEMSSNRSPGGEQVDWVDAVGAPAAGARCAACGGAVEWVAIGRCGHRGGGVVVVCARCAVLRRRRRLLDRWGRDCLAYSRTVFVTRADNPRPSAAWDGGVVPAALVGDGDGAVVVGGAAMWYLAGASSLFDDEQQFVAMRAFLRDQDRRLRRRRHCLYVFLLASLSFGALVAYAIGTLMENRRRKVMVMVLCPLMFVLLGACLFNLEWASAIIEAKQQLEMMA